jgi:hypothetical protein
LCQSLSTIKSSVERVGDERIDLFIQSMYLSSIEYNECRSQIILLIDWAIHRTTDNYFTLTHHSMILSFASLRTETWQFSTKKIILKNESTLIAWLIYQSLFPIYVNTFYSRFCQYRQWFNWAIHDRTIILEQAVPVIQSRRGWIFFKNCADY